MCTGKCALCIRISLYPLVFISIICNIMLFFPGWDVKYVQNQQITDEVKYMGGLVGGGIMVLIHTHLTGNRGCCANRCGMFLSILFSAVGVAGALYSFIVALKGLFHGLYCKDKLWDTLGNFGKDRSGSYLKDRSTWGKCTEPNNVVEFNVRLFSTLLVTSAMQLVLCALQMINGLFGCLCGTCLNKGPL
ncbi:unnamed protein product [Leuciscus chuanchicus]